MQGRVGDQHVHRPVGGPGLDVADLELQPAGYGQRLSALDHLGRTVDTADAGTRPLCDQQLGEVARTAAKVYDVVRIDRSDALHQLDERPPPLVRILQVLTRIPANRGHHRRLPRAPAAPSEPRLSLPPTLLPIPLPHCQHRYLDVKRLGVKQYTHPPWIVGPGRRTRLTSWLPPGGTNGPTSTSPRSRCSAGYLGWPGSWTGPAGPRSPSTISKSGSSTCWPHCAGPASRTSSRPAS